MLTIPIQVPKLKVYFRDLSGIYGCTYSNMELFMLILLHNIS